MFQMFKKLDEMGIGDCAVGSQGSLNNWGSTQGIPYWVKSWLENYIKAKSYNEMKERVFEIEGIKP